MAKSIKQSKSKKVLNWLNPTSPAKGALLFVIAFVVIGGGYMAFKSFASSVGVEVTAPNLFTWGGTDQAGHVHDSNTYASKSGTDAISLAYRAGFQGGPHPATAITSYASFSDSRIIDHAKTAAIDSQLDSFIPTFTTSRACAILRVPNGSAYIDIDGYQLGDGVTQTFFPQSRNSNVLVTGTEYHKVCGSWSAINKNWGTKVSMDKVESPQITLSTALNSSSFTGWVLIYSISIEVQ